MFKAEHTDGSYPLTVSKGDLSGARGVDVVAVQPARRRQGVASGHGPLANLADVVAAHGRSRHAQDLAQEEGPAG